MKLIFRHRFILISVFIIAIVFLYLYNLNKQPLLWGYHEFYYTPKKYLIKLKQQKSEKANLNSEKPKIKQVFLNQFKQLLPFWYGTRYSFYGQTHIPGESAIACGYFVTTVLEDLGINIDRNRLAQLASEQMIKELLGKESIQRFSQIDIKAFLQIIKNSGTGLYVVGLDTHTGFILYQNSDIRFIHASGSFPFAVVNEPALLSKSLIKSKYRIIGKLSDDEKILKDWIE